jgi:PIN domain nuclease of toxin-antitoxin system
MKILLDTGVWFRRYHGLPLKRSLVDFLDGQEHEFHLCPLSIAEISFKWQRGRLPGVPDPARWIDHSLENFLIVHPSPHAAKLAGLWNWSHGDLVDRLLAAMACDLDLMLVHTDRILKKLDGFPQRYFPAAAMPPR